MKLLLNRSVQGAFQEAGLVFFTVWNLNTNFSVDFFLMLSWPHLEKIQAGIMSLPELSVSHTILEAHNTPIRN